MVGASTLQRVSGHREEAKEEENSWEGCFIKTSTRVHQVLALEEENSQRPCEHDGPIGRVLWAVGTVPSVVI
ncbi:hypothetical protein Taro_044858 [Colocasia esculenta]|uniref:Uncharacterized protein n=1 Tax=Colocasia esculenta TaxID=4460 RepID=A0A843WV32_COLES|nr:hypothetical protein [Colocasia esculenta]